MPDYSRFVATSRAAMGAAVVALGPVYGLVLGTYAIAGLATHSGQPNAILVGLGLPPVVGLLVPMGLMQGGIMCLYSASLATSTIVTFLSFRVTVIISMLIGMGLALAGAASLFVEFLILLGIVFPPAVALLIYAGVFGDAFPDGEYRKWNWAEISIWCFGILSGGVSQYSGIGLTGFSAFDGFFGAAIGTATVHMVRKARTNSLR